MNILEKFGSIAAVWRGSRPSRPLNPPKPGRRLSAADEQSNGQASRPPLVAASFTADDRQA